jgi:hypothetical protein
MRKSSRHRATEAAFAEDSMARISKVLHPRNGNQSLLVRFPTADIHPNGILFQRIVYNFAPLHGAHAPTGEIILPADVI